LADFQNPTRLHPEEKEEGGMTVTINDREGTVTISQTCRITARTYSLSLGYELYCDWLAKAVPTCGLGLSEEDQYFLENGISPSGLATALHAIEQSEREVAHEQTSKQNKVKPRQAARKVRVGTSRTQSRGKRTKGKASRKV